MSDNGRTAADLIPAPYNPRKIDDARLEALGRAMETFGDLSGIVFNVRTRHVVGGHQRLKHIPKDARVVVSERFQEASPQGTIATGHIVWKGERWTYREVDWDEQTEAGANVAANKHGGEWDFPKLTELLSELDAHGFDMPLVGFSEVELEQLLTSVGGTDPLAEWQGMPEFEQPNNEAVRTIIVHFRTLEAVDDFAKRIEQTFNKDTKYIWHPYQERKVQPAYE